MTAVLLDLDGTLTDSGPGIKRCVMHALHRMGHDSPPYEQLDHCVGPPLSATFARLLPPDQRDDPARIDEAIELYRERYAPVGFLENSVYAGIDQALTDLRAAGHRLFLCTSKPHIPARRICRHFGLLEHLDGLYGAELDGTRGDKTSLISYVLEQEQLEAGTTVMVGDRHHDADGATANGLRTVGVTWGYGSAEELRDAGCAALADAPDGLARSIAGLLSGARA